MPLSHRLADSRLNGDRAFVIGGLALLVILSWAYLLYISNDMKGATAMSADLNDGMAMSAATPNMMPWLLMDWVSMFVMWSVMMVGMMVPSASPMILVFSNVNRQKRKSDMPHVSTSVFLVGYIIVWTGFSGVATVFNWVLHTDALLSGMMAESTVALLGGGLLLAAGVFQWTPWKNACLKQCRTPMGFVMTEWRDGNSGALMMGLKHGTFCLGCCWLLMALLFVLGVMNLVWIAALAVLVLVEKVAPQGVWISRISGFGLIAWGCLVLAQIIQ